MMPVRRLRLETVRGSTFDVGREVEAEVKVERRR